ncbi:hypothetical protein Vadar_019100 [Vaccinium darrowii]|uniref:Uncharacterized protein n=1 Tax=Vaccinium darrowii TaxID=229202 RepID=A0ACB7Y7L2_9ERIC|nr:hypothetical protein Vadar_019100 [Vaccinium darrowii]
MVLAASSQIVSKKRGRGPTRGKNVDKLRKILGQPIPVDINPEAMSIEGEHATSVAYAIGLNIQVHALVRDIGWGDIDFGIREFIVMRVGQIFGIGDYKNDMVVRLVIDIKCQSLYSDWKCELHNHYKYLKEKKVFDLKSHALYPCHPNDWVFMIENVWETEDLKKKSLKGQKARSFLKFNHTSGSQSFASRASIYVKKNNKKQPFTDSFKETHIHHRVGNDAWINDKAKECHEEMVRLTSKQSQLNVANPLSEEQISVKVLGKRSGYLKGYGIHKNTKFLNAMPSQAIPNQEVILMMALKSGIDPTCIPGLVLGSGMKRTHGLESKMMKIVIKILAI